MRVSKMFVGLISVLISIQIFADEKANAKFKPKFKNSELGIDFSAYVENERSAPKIIWSYYTEKKFFKEKQVFVDKPVYRVISVTDGGKVIEERKVDFLGIAQPDPCLNDKIKYPDGDYSMCWGENKFLAIIMKYAQDIKKIQIYKGAELVAESELKSLEDLDSKLRKNSEKRRKKKSD